MVDTADVIETDGVVAVITCLRGQDVARRHTDRDDVVVAALAAAGDIAVVKACTQPGVFGVTVVADITGREMLPMFTRRPAVVVTQPAVERCPFELSTEMAT